MQLLLPTGHAGDNSLLPNVPSHTGGTKSKSERFDQPIFFPAEIRLHEFSANFRLKLYNVNWHQTSDKMCKIIPYNNTVNTVRLKLQPYGAIEIDYTLGSKDPGG